MKRLHLDRDDFKNEGVMKFDDVLQIVGIVDEHGDPKKDVDQIIIVVHSAEEDK